MPRRRNALVARVDEEVAPAGGAADFPHRSCDAQLREVLNAQVGGDAWNESTTVGSRQWQHESRHARALEDGPTQRRVDG